MKKQIILLFLLFPLLGGAQVKNGELAGNLRFETVLNAPVKKITMEQLKEKYVLIDFWATWCGSCIGSMPHLSALQKKYAKNLQVILVTDETARRVSQFLATRPTGLWFNSDTAGIFSKQFPHRIVPHTVLLAPGGRLIAATSPEQVTDKVIDSLLAGQIVHLEEKKDNPMGPEEILEKKFAMPPYVRTAFVMEPQMPGAGSFSSNYYTDSNFNGRRYTGVNLGLFHLYSMAFGNIDSQRVIDSIPKKDRAAMYCVDIVVEKKEELFPTLRQELLKRFDVQARIESQLRDVYVLVVADPDKLRNIPVNTSGVRTYMARHGEIDQQNIQMKDFASFLENYGDLGRKAIVMDETGLQQHYDIKFSFAPENPESLKQVLAGMGLRVEKAQRRVDLLRLYKEQ